MAILLLLVGGVLLYGGFWGSATLRSPYDAVLAWGAPVGLLLTASGILLLIIPKFFV